MKRLISALSMGLILGATPVLAETNLKLVEVITSPARTETLKTTVAAFEASNPDVKVEIISLPWGQAFEKLATMVAGGNAPDVVEMPDTWMGLYGGSGQLVNLESNLASWDGTSQLTDKTLAMGRLVDGNAYQIPYGFYLRAMFYNKKLLAEAGVDGPPKTMADFMEASRKVSQLPGKYGYCMRGSTGGFNGWIMMAANMNGSNKFFTDDGKSTLNEPGSVKGIQFLLDMYQKGYAPKDSVSWGFNEIVTGFYSGTCAFLDQDPDALISVSEHMDAEDFAVAPMPVGPSGKSFPTIGYAGWSIFKSSKNQDSSWDLVAHLSSPEANRTWAKRVGVLPIHKGADRDPHFASEQFKGWFTELNGDAWIPTIMPTYLEKFGELASVIAVETSQDAMLGNRTAQELADGWAKILTDEYAKWKAKQ